MSTEPVARHATSQHIAWIGGSRHTIVFHGAATENRLAALRSSMKAGAASPVHVHEREDETIFVLDGAGDFWVGGKRWELGPGDSVFLPRHVPHCYTITADADLLTVCNPAGIEEFFRRVGWDLENPLPEGWTVDMKALRDVGEALGQHVLGPPLAAGDEMPAQHHSWG